MFYGNETCIKQLSIYFSVSHDQSLLGGNHPSSISVLLLTINLFTT